MNNTLLLVRHGQDTDNEKGILNGKRDTELTVLGEKQAEEVAKKLEKFNIDAIYFSPLKRAKKTAEIINTHLSAPVFIPDEDLSERDFRVLTGKPLSDIPLFAKNILKTEKVDYFLDVEGGEDFSALYSRAERFLKKIEDAYTGKTIVAVTHGDIGKMIRAAYHGWDWEKGLKTAYFANTDILELFPDETERTI